MTKFNEDKSTEEGVLKTLQSDLSTNKTEITNLENSAVAIETNISSKDETIESLNDQIEVLNTESSELQAEYLKDYQGVHNDLEDAKNIDISNDPTVSSLSSMTFIGMMTQMSTIMSFFIITGVILAGVGSTLGLKRISKRVNVNRQAIMDYISGKNQIRESAVISLIEQLKDDFKDMSPFMRDYTLREQTLEDLKRVRHEEDLSENAILYKFKGPVNNGNSFHSNKEMYIRANSPKQAAMLMQKKLAKEYPQANLWVDQKYITQDNTPKPDSELKESSETLSKHGVEGYNKPKRTPSHPTKSHLVVAKKGEDVKVVRFGAQGVKGSPKKEGESEAYRKRREGFVARHKAQNPEGMKDKFSPLYWANKEKW
jgi:hypothetical protein